MAAMYFVLGAIALIFILYLARPKPDISGEEAKKLVKAGARLIDVRTAQEFSGGHLSGARNIPLHELGGRLEELGEPGRINISGATRSAIEHQYTCTYRGKKEVHNKGLVDMYFVED